MIIKVRENLELRLRATEEAEETIAVINSNREYLRQWLPWVDHTHTTEDIVKVIKKWQDDFNAKTDIVLGVYLDNKYVGNMGLHRINKDHNSAMIGYWIASEYQGRGIMTDCVRTLTSYGFNEHGLNRIYILCAVGNKKSRAIPERLGYKLEGILQDAVCLYGVYHDEAVYGMVKRNWGQ